MDAIRFNVILVLGTIPIPLPTAPPVVAQDQDARHCPGKLEALNASYVQQLRDIERRWIAELADLADKSSGREANDAYRQLFNLAIVRDLCIDAQPAAQSCLTSIPAAQDLRALAATVQVFARAEKGEYEESLWDFKALYKRLGCGAYAAAKSDAATALAVGEAHVQRLIRDGRQDVARRLCELACKDDAPTALKDQFEARLARLDRLGKTAPLISGTDIDGRQVSLADHKGEVVLVDFWGSSCSQCVASITALDALVRKYHRRGFVILGVNLDARHPEVKDGATALPTARQFLVRHGVTWINLVDRQKTGDVIKAFGVEKIPANFLIGRDGRVVAVDQSGEALERAVARAVGGLSGCRSKCSSSNDR
jgi:peroxiredoxin